jgi:predicted lipoprotein with Yx(FWY)xxD motif
MRSTPRAIVVAAAFALALAACAGDDAPEDEAPDAGAEAADEDEPEDEATEDEEDDAAEDEAAVEDEEDEPAEGAAVVAVDTTDLGEVLVDADGNTLYMFDVDEQGPSQCYDDCEANWPPLLTEAEPEAAAGADAGLLGTVERDDGTSQVTYDDWPLYHFIGDQAPGDVAGQAVNDVWWVLAADGAPIRGDAAEEDDDEGSGGAYDY